HLGQPALRDTVSGGVGELRTLFEIDHEIDGDAGVAGPLGVGRLGAVTDEVAGHLASVCAVCDGVRGPAAASRVARRVIRATGADSASRRVPRIRKLAPAPHWSAIPPIAGGITIAPPPVHLLPRPPSPPRPPP